MAIYKRKSSLQKIESPEINRKTILKTIHSQSSRISKNSSCIIDRDAFPDWLYQRKDFQQVLTNNVPSHQIEQACLKPYIFRNLFEENAVISWLKSCPFNRSFRPSLIKNLYRKVYIKYFEKDQQIITEGDFADEMYLIVRGHVKIMKKNIEICKIGPKNSVGDIALETGKFRSATVVACTDVVMMGVKAEDYRHLLADQKHYERSQIAEFLKNLKCFSEICVSKIEHLADNIIISYHDKNSTIYDIGDESESFNIVKEGSVHLETFVTLQKKNNLPICQTLVSTKKYNYLIKKCNPSGVFGHEELENREKRRAKAISVEDCTVIYSVNFEVFNEIFTRADTSKIISHLDFRTETKELKKRLESNIAVTLRKVKTLKQFLDPEQILPSFTGRTKKKVKTWIDETVERYKSSMNSDVVEENIGFLPKV